MFDLIDPNHRGSAATLPVGGQQCLGLDRVAQHGPRSVAFDYVHLGRRQPGVGQGRAHHALLGRTVGRGQPVGRAVLVHGGAPHQRQHRVPQPLCVRQPLHHQNAAALGESGAIGRTRVGLAPAVGGQPTHAR